MQKNQESVVVVFVVLLVIQLLFGINYSTSKVIVTQVDPFLWSNIRFIIAAIVLGVVTLVMRRPHPKVDKHFILPLIPLSLLGMSLGQAFFLVGLKNTTSVNTAIITSAIPILTMLVAMLKGDDKMNRYKFWGLVLSFSGVIFIREIKEFNFGSQTFFGDMMVFLAAMCFALYLNFAKKFLPKYDNLWITTWMFLFAGIAMTLYNVPLWINFTMPTVDSTFIGSAIFTILGATVLTYFLNNWALKRASAGNVAIFIYLQPVVAGILGWYFLGEIITLRTVVCSLLIFTGVVISLKKASA